MCQWRFIRKPSIRGNVPFDAITSLYIFASLDSLRWSQSTNKVMKPIGDVNCDMLLFCLIWSYISKQYNIIVNVTLNLKYSWKPKNHSYHKRDYSFWCINQVLVYNHHKKIIKIKVVFEGGSWLQTPKKGVWSKKLGIYVLEGDLVAFLLKFVDKKKFVLAQQNFLIR